MQKFFVLLVLVTSFSLTAMADEKTNLFQCTFKLDDHTQMFKNLEAKLDVFCGPTPALCMAFGATFTLACDICKAMPQDFGLNASLSPIEANFDGTINNATLKLDIPLESYVATKTHHATMTYPNFSNKPIDGTCTDLR